jgi:hypothetical protein
MELRLSIRVFGTNTSTGFWSGNGLVLSEELRRSRGVDWKAPVSARTPAAQLIANFSAMHVELGARPTGAWWPASMPSSSRPWRCRTRTARSIAGGPELDIAFVLVYYTTVLFIQESGPAQSDALSGPSFIRRQMLATALPRSLTQDEIPTNAAVPYYRGRRCRCIQQASAIRWRKLNNKENSRFLHPGKENE